MPDQSHLDRRYFIDERIYNCPFCNRRHVSYSIYSKTSFDWSSTKTCHAYFARCHSCGGSSMHLAFTELVLSAIHEPQRRWRFSLEPDVDAGEFLDSTFFYSVPTSFFVLDERIPRVLRELLAESEGCLKSNFLTGASACARKLVYELSSIESAQGDNYEDRIKSLKTAHPEIEPTYFDTLLTIQQLTSTKVHENSFDGWESKHLRVILASLSEILNELYVVPALREDRRSAIVNLKKALTSESATAKTKET